METNPNERMHLSEIDFKSCINKLNEVYSKMQNFSKNTLECMSKKNQTL